MAEQEGTVKGILFRVFCDGGHPLFAGGMLVSFGMFEFFKRYLYPDKECVRSQSKVVPREDRYKVPAA